MIEKVPFSSGWGGGGWDQYDSYSHMSILRLGSHFFFFFSFFMLKSKMDINTSGGRVSLTKGIMGQSVQSVDPDYSKTWKIHIVKAQLN